MSATASRPAASFAAPVGGRLVELSALHADELDSVLAAAASDLSGRFERVSIHAPVKGLAPPAELLVARLDATGRDVVAHPDAMVAQSGGDVEVFAALADRLLVETNDGRKDFGAAVEDLEPMFSRLPAARMCLDVSHALHAGVTDRLRELVDRFGDRIMQLHVGCACGEPLGFDFDVPCSRRPRSPSSCWGGHHPRCWNAPRTRGGLGRRRRMRLMAHPHHGNRPARTARGGTQEHQRTPGRRPPRHSPVTRPLGSISRRAQR